MLTIMVHALQMAFQIFWDHKMVLELVNFFWKDKEAQLWENHIVAIHEKANRLFSGIEMTSHFILSG